ncbi:TetR/AcrR family transcriptional regulator [Trujillonella humicola]|uniref:TetR/AcrR family transcriptional regulator n=1 Tax=Trujillonella humicola TaxID=3383699 RepID=UPI0039061E3A
MTDGGIVRRQGYWPMSPVVGSRGARTRERIVAEALTLFEQQGFRATSVESIARAAGTSRATLYQYFESKEQIFVELMDECGAALRRVARRIGALGPTRAGFHNLHWWLGEWAWVYDKYATLFGQWADLEPGNTGVRHLVHGFVGSYNRWIADRLAECGVSGVDPGEAALVLTSTVHRFNYFRHQRTGLPPADEAVDGLAVVLQLMLFPETPAEAFAGLPDPPPRGRVHRGGAPGVAPDAGHPTELSPRAAVTVGEMVKAGARLFAERGYHGTSVDDVVAEAGFARATFYKYFDEKSDLLLRLTEESSSGAAELCRDLAVLEPGPDLGPGLRDWLRRYLPFYRRYLGVFRAGIDGGSGDARVTALARQVNADLAAAVGAVLARVERAYPLDRGVATVVVMAVLDRMPEYARFVGDDDDRIVELAATVLERGPFNGATASASARTGAPGG